MQRGTAESAGESWIVRLVPPIFGTILCTVAVIFAAELHLKVGLILFTEQALALILALTLAMVFIMVPSSGGVQRRTRVPWHDILFSLFGFGAGMFLAVRYPVIARNFFEYEMESFAAGIVMIPLIIEALRRVAGWGLMTILAAFLAYALFGYLIPGSLKARSLELVQLVAYLTSDNIALFGLAMNIMCTVVIMFIFLGQLLLKSGGSEWFTELATALMGRSRGGSAKIAVVASSLFGTISGIAVSNVASTGIITIPLMKQAGFEPRVAGAFEAVSSAGGQIMPPIMGAAAFLMAEFLDVPYTEVLLAALIPAILYYVSVFIQADLEAVRKNIPPVPADKIPRLSTVLRDGWFFALPFVLLIFALFTLGRRPEEAALWAAGCVVALNWVFGYKKRRITLRDLYHAVRDTGTDAVEIVIIGAMAGLIIGVLKVTGLGFVLTFLLVEIGENNLLVLLFMTALICVVLGMSMPTPAIYILVATLAAPPLIKLGVDPMAAHLFVLYFGIASTITPPVAVPAFVAAKLAEANPLQTALTAVRLGWTAYVVPFLFVFSPSLVMRGTPIEVTIAFVSAIAGVWLATAGLLGAFVRPLDPMTRVGFAAAGLGLLIPSDAFVGAIYAEIAGAVLTTIMVAREVIAIRRIRTMSPGSPIIN